MIVLLQSLVVNKLLLTVADKCSFNTKLNKMEKDNNKVDNWDEYNEKLHLSDVMFSIFTLDEIRTIIKHRQFRGMKTLQMSKDKQDEFREIIKKIEDMFDV